MGAIAVLFAMASCDTADNINSPDYFVKYFGTEGNQEGVDLIVNADGTMLLFGNTTLPGDTNPKLYLAKCDANGKLLWERPPFGGDFKNQARDIEVTSDGRIMLLATSERAVGDNDVLLILADANGVELKRTMHGYANTDEDASSVTQTSDGFIVTGSTSNTSQKANQVANDQRDAFNFRFYEDLTSFPNVWNETLGPGTFDYGTKVIEVNPGQFYFFGYSNKKPSKHDVISYNFWIFPLNNVGNAEFINGEEIFVGEQLVDEKLSSVVKSPLQAGEGYLLTGLRTSTSGVNIYMAKLRKNLSFSAGEVDQVFQFPPAVLPTEMDLGQVTVTKTSNSYSVLSGFLILSSERSSGNENFYLTKITNTGGNAWSQPKGFVYGGQQDDRIGAVADLPDGSIVMIGTFSVGDDYQDKVTLIKVNKDGKFN